MNNSGAISVRGVTIGAGIPKICIPILGATAAEVAAGARAVKAAKPDLVEWRIDWFPFESAEELFPVLNDLRTLFDSIPLLLTFRTLREGGARELSGVDYEVALCRLIKTGLVDCVDVELFSGDDIVRNIVDTAHSCGVSVIGSSHDFTKTPPESELIARLERMAALGCDVAKIAVMPQNGQDVLTLLSATAQMRKLHPETPLITMSMGQLGMVSRLCGEVFGSAVTFGSAGQASAPGQVDAEELSHILKLLHGQQGNN